MLCLHFENLPKEITYIILEYQGYHKNRNGKYMKQLYIDDPKYKYLIPSLKI